MSQAVIVDGAPLVYTRQLLPLGRDGKLVGEGSADKQSEQVLANLDAVLNAAGSGLDKLVRLNVYALSHEAAGSRARAVAQATRPGRPARDHHGPHAAAAPQGAGGRRCGRGGRRQRPGRGLGALRVRGRRRGPAPMPPCCRRGGVAYLSGVPATGGLTVSAVAKSLSTLFADARASEAFAGATSCR